MKDNKKTDCVYQISCKNCSHIYIGETGRIFGTRLEERKKEAENIKTRRFIRELKRVSTVIEHTSAITYHADRNNCILDWGRAKVNVREYNRNTRWIKEAIWIGKTTPAMNRDEGVYIELCMGRLAYQDNWRAEENCHPRIIDEGCRWQSKL